jgi:hypothetical protein
VGNAPLDWTEMRFKNNRFVPDSDKSFWIPGDWGYIIKTRFDSTLPNMGGMDGENVICLGGSLEDDNFNAFAEEGNFWGHGFEIMSLKQMMMEVQDWANAPFKLANVLCDLSQDNLEE